MKKYKITKTTHKGGFLRSKWAMSFLVQICYAYE